MSENNKSRKISKKVLWTRIFCAFLALIMVAGVAYMSVNLVLDSIKESKEEKEKAAKTETASHQADDNDYYLIEL